MSAKPHSLEGNTLVGALVECYGSLVGGLRQRFGSHQDAQDTVHDVCLRLLESPPAQEVRSPEAFVRRLSTDLAIDRYRVASGRQRLLADAGDDPATAPRADRDPEQAAAHRQTLEALLQVIDGLPVRCREVFILHRLHGVPQDQVAARLGISRNMVARHVMRAMKDLRAVLKEDDQAP